MAPRLLRIAAIATAWIVRAADAGAADDLADAWTRALATSSQLAAVQYEAEAAQHDAAAAASERLPQASVRSGYEVRSDERNFRIDNPFAAGTIISPYRQREAALSTARVTAPLYTGGRIANTVHSADASAEACAADAATARLDLLMAVAEAYLGVLRAQRAVAVADEQIASLSAHAADAAQQRELQRISQADYLAALAAVADAQQIQASRRLQLAAARGEYNRLTGQALAAPVSIAEVSVPPLPGPLCELQQLALNRRPELASLAASAAGRAYAAEAARAANRPQVVFEGRCDYEENRYQTPQAVATAGVAIDWSLYDGGEGRRRACAETARAASLRRLVDDQRQRILLEVQDQWHAERIALELLVAATKSQEHAAESLRVSRLRFANGLAVGAEVRDAVARQAAANQRYFEAGYDLAAARLRLRRAVGVLGNGS